MAAQKLAQKKQAFICFYYHQWIYQLLSANFSLNILKILLFRNELGIF